MHALSQMTHWLLWKLVTNDPGCSSCDTAFGFVLHSEVNSWVGSGDTEHSLYSVMALNFVNHDNEDTLNYTVRLVTAKT